MNNIPDDPNTILDIAIANEVEGHKILTNAKESANTALAKATFDFLASEELNHIELIKDFAKTLAGAQEWDDSRLKEISLSEAGSHIKNIFERFAAEFETVSASSDERLETYKVAMDMEHRGYDFYSGAAKKVHDERAKQLFNFLAAEEERHFKMIQDTHDFLNHPDGIMAMEERWMQI